MGERRKRIADGVIFILIGLNTLWLWLCSGAFVLTTLINENTDARSAAQLRHITISRVFEDLGVPVVVQGILFLAFALFFIAWGIWTLRINRKRPDSPACKGSTKRILLFGSALTLLLSGYFIGRHEMAAKAQEQIERLDKRYIPADLEQCFEQIDLMLSEEQREIIKSGTEDDMDSYHHGLGTGIRNSFGLWRGPLIGTWFREHGVEHPDSMSSIILQAYWRSLNDLPVETNRLILDHHAYYKHRDPEYYVELMEKHQVAQEKEAAGKRH